MSTAEESRSCSYQLAVLLQAVACCEAQVERSRLALHMLPYYTPSLAYKIMGECCALGIVTHRDVSNFLE